MKVASPFKDYYDSALDRHIEEGIFWHRKPLEYRLGYSHRPTGIPSWLSTVCNGHIPSGYGASTVWVDGVRRGIWKNEATITPYSVLLAGKKYLAVSVKWRLPFTAVKEGELAPARKTFFSLETLLASADEKKAATVNFQPNGVDRFQVCDLPETTNRLMQENGCPLVLISNDEVVANACLRQYHLDGILPPYQVAQELRMWFGNIASRDDTPVTISDKDRATQHGYDKWSFRKQPEWMNESK